MNERYSCHVWSLLWLCRVIFTEVAPTERNLYCRSSTMTPENICDIITVSLLIVLHVEQRFPDFQELLRHKHR